MSAKLGSRQWLCWSWPGLTRNQQRDVLSVMTTDKSLSIAHRRTAQRKLREMRQEDRRG
jgi:hypothetical protein